MLTSLSLRSLLDNDKLTGHNFDSWYRRLRIVLEYERISYVLTDPAPEVSAANAQDSVRDAYQKWIFDRTTVRCIMLSIMNDEFSRIFKETQPADIIQVLKDSLGIPDDVERYKMSCTIFNAKIREGVAVTNHVLYMIEMIKRLGKLRCPLHKQLDKDAILNSLPSSYLDFLDHYRMNKPTVNYHGLMGLLQTYERDHQLSKGVVNLVRGSGDHRRPFGKGNKKKEEKRVQGAPGPSQAEKVRAGQASTECFYCKKQRH